MTQISVPVQTFIRDLIRGELSFTEVHMKVATPSGVQATVKLDSTDLALNLQFMDVEMVEYQAFRCDKILIENFIKKAR